MFNKIRSLFRSTPLDNPSVSLSSPANWSWLSGGRMSAAGIRVDPHTSLEAAAVLACVKLLSESVSSMPLRLYKQVRHTTGVTHNVEAVNHQVSKLLTIAPNPEMTPIVLIGVLMIQSLLWGNGYIEIQRNGMGQPIALWPRMAWHTEIRRDENDGQLFFLTSDVPSGTPPRRISADDMIMVPGMTVDGLIGHHAVHAARQIVGLSLAQDRFAGHFYMNYATPNIAITAPEKAVLKPEQKTQMRQAWESLQSGSNQHRVAILDQGMDIKVLSSSPVDAQLTETRKLSREDVAMIYRCPLTLLGITDKAPRATAEQMSQDYLKYSLNPWLQRIEQAFAAKLLPTANYVIKFDTRELLRGDLLSRYTSYNTGRMAGFLSVNEVRAMENMPPIPGGDVYLQPSNYQSVSDVPNSADSIEAEDAEEQDENQ